MHRIYRQILIFSVSLISIIVSCNKCQKREQKQEWTPQFESQVHDLFYSQSANLTTNERAKQEYADCCVSKFKELFPKGISNVSDDLTDSVKLSIMKMGVECAKNLERHINVWTPENKKQLQLQLYSMEESKSLPKGFRTEYVDCVTFKVTARFPTGLTDSGKTVVQDFMGKARKDCLLMVANKYIKTKKLK